MERNNKIPVKRISRFYDEFDFSMELDLAKDFIENDMRFTVILYRVDRDNSGSSDIYGESKLGEIRYHQPVELYGIIELEESENKTYSSNGNLRYKEYGNLNFSVLTTHLKEKNVDINYGDIIAFSDYEDNLKYFEVFDDGRINSDNSSTHFGYKGYYRLVKCVPIDPNVFDGK